MIKTKKDWDESGLNLGVFMPFPCEIDEEMYNYIGEVVAPNSTYHNDIAQCGEATAKAKYWGTFTYMTAISILDANEERRYFYIGELPEFKDPWI